MGHDTHQTGAPDLLPKYIERDYVEGTRHAGKRVFERARHWPFFAFYCGLLPFSVCASRYYSSAAGLYYKHVRPRPFCQARYCVSFLGFRHQEVGS